MYVEYGWWHCHHDYMVYDGGTSTTINGGTMVAHWFPEVGTQN